MGMHGGTLLDGWRGRVIKDWTFVSNISLGSGLPLTPNYGVATRGTSSPGASGPITPEPISTRRPPDCS